ELRRTRLVGVDLDVLAVHRVRREKAEHGTRGEPPALDDPAQHRLSLGEHLARLRPHDRVVEYRRIRAGELPRLEERAPVDVLLDFGEVVVLEYARAEHLRA